MIKKIGHIGVTVNNLEEVLDLFKRVFGFKHAEIKEILGGKVRMAFVPVGDDEIELIHPLDPDVPIGGLPQDHEQRIHHISLVTDDIEAEVKRMREKGVIFTAEEPKIGAHGVKIIFTKPETTGGIAIELCEEA